MIESLQGVGKLGGESDMIDEHKISLQLAAIIKCVN